MATRIEVDFNSRDDVGYLPAPLADIIGPYRQGDAIEAFDDEGNRCTVVIAAIEGRFVALLPLWQTFTPPDASRLMVINAGLYKATGITGLTVAITRPLGPEVPAPTGGTQPVAHRFTGSPYVPVPQ